jgi:hypothetical protein
MSSAVSGQQCSWPNGGTVPLLVWSRDGEPMTCVLKMSRGKIFFAAGIDVPFFKLLLLNRRLYIMRNVCVCVCVCVYTNDCVQTVFELPLLPNSTATETFLHKLGGMRSVDRIFIIGAMAWR